jgi:CheY-like chemotaxis protein
LTEIHALIIDDENNNIEVLGLLLGREGASFTGVPHARDIEKQIAGLDPLDVIFLDLEIPGSAPYQETLNLLRQIPALADVPVVAYTVDHTQIDHARRAGFDHFLGKPLNVREFPEQFRRILAGEPVWEYWTSQNR